MITRIVIVGSLLLLLAGTKAIAATSQEEVTPRHSIFSPKILRSNLISVRHKVSLPTDR